MNVISFDALAADVTVFDFNNTTVAPTWTHSSGLTMYADSCVARVGCTYSAKWNETVEGKVMTSPALTVTDWSAYSYVNMWVYSAVANNALISFCVYGLDTTSTEFYYRRTFNVDFTGWKIVSLPLSKFSTTSTSSNWKNLSYIKFASSGWGTTPILSTELNFDKIWLSTEQPVETTCSAPTFKRSEYEGVEVSVDIRADVQGSDAVMVAELYDENGVLSTSSKATASNISGEITLMCRMADKTSTDLRVTVYKDLAATEPMIKTEKIYAGPQVVMIKLDDLKVWSYNGGFKTVKEVADSEGVPISFGVIASELADEAGVDKTGYYDFIKYCHNNGTEIWHHGYYHTTEEYSTNTAEQQYESFKMANDIVLEKCGIQMRMFGSPMGNNTQVTSDMITQNFPEYKIIMSGQKDFTHPAGVYQLRNRVKIEPSTANLSYDLFVESYIGHENDPYIIIAGHPWGWDDTEMEEFRSILKFLKERNTRFMLPSDYYDEYLK